MVAGRANAAPARSTGSLVGTGATFPFPLISKWIPEVGKAYGIDITYSPTGSGAGIAGITARTVDFGASDAPLSQDQLAACKGCVVIPWALAAISIPYNLPGLNGRIRLSGQTLANIYLGSITSWNDAAIKKLNPSLDLPDTKITPVYRSDGSGTHLRLHGLPVGGEPAVEEPRRQQHERQLPDGHRRAGQLGRGGRREEHAGRADLRGRRVLDPEQAPVRDDPEPGREIHDAGAARDLGGPLAAAEEGDQLSQLKIVDPPKAAGKVAYPISTFTYVIIPTHSAKAADLRKFVYWAVTQGQKFGPPLFFVPLPNTVKAFAYREIAKVKAST